MPHLSIIDRMKETPVVFDGAMGTMIYERGVFINRCFDELCLSDPSLVREIHQKYIDAGVDVIETNTFGANRVLLQSFGLADRVAEINETGAKLARECAGDDVYVAGSVGPCLRRGQTLSDRNMPTLKAAFEECTRALAAGGVDFLLLETFSDIDELLLAAEVAARTGLPILTSFTVGTRGETSRGKPLEEIVPLLQASAHVDAIGMNCGAGPSPLCSAAERALPLTDKPFVLMPNAGQPQEVEGRTLYMTTPEYFTTYARLMIKIGAAGIGGCCGTTPAHMGEVAKAVHSVSGVSKQARVKTVVSADVGVDPMPTAEKSPFGAKLMCGDAVTSIEILPPRSSDLTDMLKKVRICHEHGIDAINIPDGPRASARISPMIAALTIHQQIGIEPILHYCCRDRNLIGMQSDLMGGFAAGLCNFLIITGDPPKLGDYPDATGVFDVDAIGLVRMAANLNRGVDIGGTAVKPPCNILIGVGANPCDLEPDVELARFGQKLEAGAEYAITQPIFDPEALLRFLDDIHKFPRTIPVVAGVWPLTSFKNAEFMKNEVPGVEIPDSILERMSTCKSKEDGWKMGTEIARDIRDAIADAVAGFQVSAPFGKVELALDVLA
jgi:methionine synthase I (cobalamin-dependent)/5,10-methylenetetrahydrofolate reductase